MGRTRRAVPGRPRRPCRCRVEVERIAGGKIAECWLVPFDQDLFDELWS